MHTPYYKRHPDARALVAFVHGFMGGPGQFGDFAQMAYDAGFSVLAVLLPGHGGTGRDFAAYGAAHWQSHLTAELERYGGPYEDILLVAHSMGGLLCLNASLNVPKIRGAFLLSTPARVYYLHPRSLAAKMRLVTLPRGHAVRQAYGASNSIGGAGIFTYPLWLKPFGELMKLMRRTRRELHKVKIPVVLVHSKNDETVSYSSAKLLYDGLTGCERRALTLKESWHAYYTAEERAQITAELMRFLNANSGEAAASKATAAANPTGKRI